MALLMNLELNTIEDIFTGKQLVVLGKGNFPLLGETKMYLYHKQEEDYPGGVIGEADIVKVAEVRTEHSGMLAALSGAPEELLRTSGCDLAAYIGNVKKYSDPVPHNKFVRGDNTVVKIPPARCTRVKELNT